MGRARPEPRPDIALGKGYHSPQLDVRVRLNTNESPEPPPEAWQREVTAAATTVPWHRYPDREAKALRSALADHHRVDAAHVFAANGSNEVLQAICLAYGGPGRAAVVFEPTYALHSHIARLTATTVVAGDRGDDFTLDIDEVRRVIDQVKPAITFLCSPNNPTGMIEPEAIVRDVLERVPGLLVVDEAYAQFAPWTALDLLAEDDDRPLIVTRTYSKTWATAGLRLGYGIGPEHVVEHLHKVALPYHLDAFKQLAGTLALDHEPEMRARVAALVEEHGRVQARLTDLDVDVWPSAANFVLFRPRRLQGDAVWKALVDRSILVRDCSTWPRLDGCLRVTVGSINENETFLTALSEILDGSSS